MPTPEVYKREQKPLYNPKSSQHVKNTKDIPIQYID